MPVGFATERIGDVTEERLHGQRLVVDHMKHLASRALFEAKSQNDPQGLLNLGKAAYEESRTEGLPFHKVYGRKVRGGIPARRDIENEMRGLLVDEFLKRDLLLSYKPRHRKFAREMHVDYGADPGGSCYLNGTPVFAANGTAVDLARIAHLNELSFAHSGDRAKRDHDILKRNRQRRLENVL